MAATHPFNIVVTDSLGATATQPFTLNLSPAVVVPPTPTVTFTSASYAPQVQNGGTVNYKATVATTGGGGPYTFSLDNPPAGWSINPTTGVVTSPALTVAGSYFFGVIVSDGVTTNAKQVGYTVAAVPVTVTPGVPALIVPALGPYQLTPGTILLVPVVATGAGPFSYGVSAAQSAWASVSAGGTLTLNGNTAPSGNQSVSLNVTDANGATVTSIISVYVGTLQGFLTRVVNASKSVLTRVFKVT
jgi:large repetitive protein